MKTKKLFIIAAILFAGVFSTTAKAESQNFASNLDLLIKSSVKYPAEAKEAGISVELIDLRTIFPIDKETITNSIKKTGRIVIVAEAPSSFSVGAELIAIANEEAFLHLEAPPKRVMGFDTIVPLAKGEHFFMQTPEKIFYEIERTVKF